MLKNQFEQRKIGKTAASFRQQTALTTPSGPQWTESALEASAVIQIAFVPTVVDIITQPILRYTLAGKDRQYTPDIAATFAEEGDPIPERFIIEIKRREELENKRREFADKFYAAREECAKIGFEFRVLHEGHLETAYYRNARKLLPELSRQPDFSALDLLQSKFGKRKFTRADGAEVLSALYQWQWEAAEMMNVLIAWRVIHCDLTADIDDGSEIRVLSQSESTKQIDPFLKMLRNADSGVNV